MARRSHSAPADGAPDSPAAPVSTLAAASPVARRAKAPKWLDLRMLLGLVLVIGSVVAGAQIVASADKTVQVWALTRDLAAGSTIAADDIEVVDVRLDDQAGSYLDAGSDPTGKTITREVSAGDLLPARAIGDPGDTVSLAVAVPAASVPATVSRGDRIALYATPPAKPGATDQVTGTAVVVPSATVDEISDRSQGALSVGTGELQIVITVPSCAVSGILDQTTGRLLTVVEVPANAEPSHPVC